MALKIVWTHQAKRGLQVVLEYLEREWTRKEILKLENNLQTLLSQIIKNPELYPNSITNPTLFKALIDKNNYLVYRVQKKENIIQVISFRGTKQYPLH